MGNVTHNTDGAPDDMTAVLFELFAALHNNAIHLAGAQMIRKVYDFEDDEEKAAFENRETVAVDEASAIMTRLVHTLQETMELIATRSLRQWGEEYLARAAAAMGDEAEEVDEGTTKH